MFPVCAILKKLGWLVKKQIKILLMKYKNDKHLNKILGHDRHECQYYKYMNIWNGQCISDVNQCEQVFKKIITTTTFKPHNMIYFRILQDTRIRNFKTNGNIFGINE